MALTRRNITPTRDGIDTRERGRDVASLLFMLDDADATLRRWAAHDLYGCAGASTALVARLLREDVPSVRAVLLEALASIADEIAVNGLVGCLRSEDAALRNEAIEALKRLPAELAPVMGSLLADADPDVRILAINILETLRHPDVERWLLDVIERDAHLNVCATAVDLLGEVGTSAAREPLLELQARFPQEPYMQFASALALTRISQGQ